MKYILFEKSAVEALLAYKHIQTIEFQTGLDFSTAIFNRKEIDLGIPNVICKTTENGYLFVGKNADDNFITIDLEQSKILEKTSKSEFISILQKIFRFSIRYWNNFPFTVLEKIIPDSSKAVVFPFPISRNSENSFRLTIEREPNQKRSEKRGLSKLLFVYDYGDTSYSNTNEFKPELKNFVLSMDAYINHRFEMKKQLQEIENLSNYNENEKPLHIIDSCVIKDNDSCYLPFNKWDDKLTISQKKFIYDISKDKPIRIQGPAGTGKTISLILKSIYLLKKAEEENQECRILYVNHSKATKNSSEIIFNIISSDKNWQIPEKNQTIKITTLHEFCIETLAKNISDEEILDRDAYDSKEMQLYTIMESFDRMKGRAFKTYENFMSNDLKNYLTNEENINIYKLLQHEFAVQIKGIAESDLEKYIKLPPLDTGIPIRTEDDKKFIYIIFTDYQKSIESLQVYDTDDIVISAMGSFDNPIWRRKRKIEGYDYVFIDETHLFNSNEKNIFHYLTKDIEKIAINFSVDISQAMGEQGVTKEEYLNEYFNSSVDSDIQNLDVVFRCSNYITDLAMAITASGSMLFENFINPYSDTTISLTEKDDHKIKKPSYSLFNSEREMLDNTLKLIVEIKNNLKCSESEIAIIAFSDLLFEELDKNLKDNDISFEVIKSRGDLKAKNKAKNNNSFILSMPEYIGGLEFSAVILVGVDSGRVPPNNIHDISKKYLTYTAYNKLYVSITRARYQVFILGSLEYGISDCLSYSIEQEVIDFADR